MSRGFLLPFGHRRSLLGHPVPAEGLGPPHGRLTGHVRRRTPTGFPRSARTSHDREGCPLYPGDDGAHPGLRTVLGRRLPHLNGPSLHPAPTFHLRGFTSRGINEGSRNSPVRSSPRLWPPGWNEQPLGLSPELRTPPTGAGRRTSG